MDGKEFLSSVISIMDCLREIDFRVLRDYFATEIWHNVLDRYIGFSESRVLLLP